ncbi:hypothetical protein D0817_02935 [Flavobacterium cupreum]|uniref:Uncharacterized protein n=1 Tax=Flavobacterium cupreum TaxID=2133766 RepID=A0A434ACE1_9FLAO|nr:hypothetical protein [Flavobacterium cupreum]RUT72033.1 hypothetical protein D0817_02935 [Flavobacterium cupreum]
MKLFFKNKIFLFLFLPFVFISCSSDLDFDQVDDLKLEPVFVANVAHFDVPANEFTDDGQEQLIAFDEKEFDVFKKKFFTDNLVKLELDCETENTIARAFTIDLLLLNENGNVLETVTLETPAYSGNANVIKHSTELFEGQRLDLLKQTVKIRFVVKMGAGVPLDENSAGSLKLRSGATAYLVIE